MKTRSPFLNEVIAFMQMRQYSLRTIRTYIKWISSFIHFHHKQHPITMGDNEVEQYLNYLVLEKNVSPRKTLFSHLRINVWKWTEGNGGGTAAGSGY